VRNCGECCSVASDNSIKADTSITRARKMKKNKLKRKIGEPEATTTTQVSDSGIGDNVIEGGVIATSKIQEAPGSAPIKKRSGPAKAKSVDDVAVEPFDYSSVPNLLDAGDDSRAEPEAGGSSARKSKKLKTGKEKKDTGKGRMFCLVSFPFSACTRIRELPCATK
jgi:hypothetical protein